MSLLDVGPENQVGFLASFEISWKNDSQRIKPSGLHQDERLGRCSEGFTLLGSLFLLERARLRNTIL